MKVATQYKMTFWMFSNLILCGKYYSKKMIEKYINFIKKLQKSFLVIEISFILSILFKNEWKWTIFHRKQTKMTKKCQYIEKYRFFHKYLFIFSKTGILYYFI